MNNWICNKQTNHLKRKEKKKKKEEVEMVTEEDAEEEENNNSINLKNLCKFYMQKTKNH